MRGAYDVLCRADDGLFAGRANRIARETEEITFADRVQVSAPQQLGTHRGVAYARTHGLQRLYSVPHDSVSVAPKIPGVLNWRNDVALQRPSKHLPFEAVV